MQKVTSQVSTGTLTPTLVGPTGGFKLHHVLIILLLLMGIAGVAFWGTVHPEARTEPISHETPPLASPSKYSVELSPSATLPAPPVSPIVEAGNVRHEDIYFEVGRRGLTDEAKTLLQKQTTFMTANPDWGVLIQGHTDMQGSDGYNQILGLKRAETVKQYLIHLGVSEHAIKTVSLGKAGALCADLTDPCRSMNRRVHLEFRKVGLVHMTPPPPVVAQPTEEPGDEAATVERDAVAEPTLESDPSSEAVSEPEPTDSSTGNLHP